MKKISILIFVMLTTTTLIFLAQASEAGGKCNGSASCNICTNCTRCLYYKGGGSWGLLNRSRKEKYFQRDRRTTQRAVKMIMQS
jgi:hypothetical protein